MKTLRNALIRLIEVARIIGLNKNELKKAKDYLVHNEYGLCFDTIITHMYEYDIEIDSEIYTSISKMGECMNLSQDSYCFMKELIREKENISMSVKDE